MKKYIKADVVDIFDEEFGDIDAIARDPNTRPETLRRIAELDDYDDRFFATDVMSLRLAVAKNPNAPGTYLENWVVVYLSLLHKIRQHLQICLLHTGILLTGLCCGLLQRIQIRQ